MKDEDTNLMLRLKEGDQGAFRTLVERHKLTVLNLCLRFTGNRDDAEDLAQDVFIRVYQAAPRYEIRAAFTTWLYRIAVNVCLNHQRRKKILNFFSLNNRHSSSGAVENHLPELVLPQRPDSDLERKELQQLVQNAIESLPENQKSVLILHRYHDLSYQQIATVLQTTVSAVESRLHRAKMNLKKQLRAIAHELDAT
ncbi:MAG: RNA polymerase sigma factor [candidate division KSB1 bacterium]|nr:RNA polymerase sigma factor [candidate division KSB1 bacterium]MDZ7317514.1 RNA polymerase sigma factor [candidate division KSB1 bacterium]MDZ7342503.1 RNA polymerase sigma factor [candidate division KSB1 bacterium]